MSFQGAGAEVEVDKLWSLLIEFTFSQRNWWVAICAEFDLTPTQGKALQELDPENPVPMHTLAGGLGCDASNVTGLIDKLESKGLVERQSANGDRRVKVLAVTPAGNELRKQLWRRAMRPPAALAGLSPKTREQLMSAIQAILVERS